VDFPLCVISLAFEAELVPLGMMANHLKTQSNFFEHALCKCLRTSVFRNTV